MAELHVGLGKSSYTILIENGLRHRLPQEIKKIYSGKKIAVITDHNVNAHYGAQLEEGLQAAGYETLVVVLPAGERPNAESSSLRAFPLQEIAHLRKMKLFLVQQQ